MVDDEVILSKLRRSLKGNTPKTGIRGNWFTGGECVRLLELLGHKSPPRPVMPAPVASISVNAGPSFTMHFAGSFRFEPGLVLDVYRRVEDET